MEMLRDTQEGREGKDKRERGKGGNRDGRGNKRWKGRRASSWWRVSEV